MDQAPVNNMLVRLIFILLFALLPVLTVATQEPECHSSPGYDPDSSPDTQRSNFEQQFVVAERLRQLTARAGAEWLETEGLLVRSREQAGSNHWGEALQLVQKACRQAELALQQAEYESEAWKRRVID